MSGPGNPLTAPLPQLTPEERQTLARESWEKLREQAEAGELDSTAPPPPATAPSAPSFDLSKSDPAGWAAYQQDVQQDSDKIRRAMREETKKVLPPLGSGQNAYVLYNPDGSVAKWYTPGNARNLPPDQAAQLVAITIHPSLWNQIKGGANWAVDAYKVAYLGGTYDKKPLPPLFGGPAEVFEDVDEGVDDLEKVPEDAESLADKAAKLAETLGDKLADTGGALLDDLEDLAQYAPYLLLALAAGAAFYVARPLFSGSARSE